MHKVPSVLLELQYLPPVHSFAYLAAHPSVFIEAQENYVKGSYRNRAHIASANGVQRLSIPLKKGKNEQMGIQKVALSFHQPWPAQHWQAIRSAYGNSPFFAHYEEEVKVFYLEKKYRHLWDFNLGLLLVLVKLLGLKTEIQLTDEYQKQAPPDLLDLRGIVSPKAKIADRNFSPVRYPQVFEDRHGFLPNLSILDLLFCEGPAARGTLVRSLRQP